MKMVDDVIEERRQAPVRMFGLDGEAEGEWRYLQDLRDTYKRTVTDIAKLFNDDRGKTKVLEIGAFMGVVSISLRRLGFDVSAVDIPEFHQSSNLRALYARNGVPFSPLNLRHSKLPFEDESLDAVIICEVLEHLNFNPIPVLLEINRVLRKGGRIYVGMPNQARLSNRVKLLRGRSVHNPVHDFFQALDGGTMMVGIHWREYTVEETVQMLQRTGFGDVQPALFSGKVGPLKKLFFLYPPFRPFQVVVAAKASLPSYDFVLTEANS
jgi:SAM-dependent methyltransferase